MGNDPVDAVDLCGQLGQRVQAVLRARPLGELLPFLPLLFGLLIGKGLPYVFHCDVRVPGVEIAHRGKGGDGGAI